MIPYLLNHEVTLDQQNELGVTNLLPMPPDMAVAWQNIPAGSEWLEVTVFWLKNSVLTWLLVHSEEGGLVWVQGEPGATFYLANQLYLQNRIPIYATTERFCQEFSTDNGIKTTRLFKHCGFRTYFREASHAQC